MLRFHFHIEGKGFGGNEVILSQLIPYLESFGAEVVLTTDLSVETPIISDHFVGIHGKVFQAARFARGRNTPTTWIIGHPVSLSPDYSQFHSLADLLFDQILFQSEFLKRDYGKWQKERSNQKRRVILSGVDTGFFSFRGNSSREKIRRELGIPLQAPLIVSSARRVGYKNIPLLLETFCEVRKQFPNAHFLLLSPEFVTETHSQNIRTLSLIHSLVPYYYSAADILLSCAEQEGLGCALLEAMACELPVVAHRSGGFPEIGGGVLVDKLSPEAFSEAICPLLKDAVLRKKIGKASRSLIRKKYSQGQMLESYREAICHRIN